ncbi:AraC family transcriptional regulator [Cystobacter fuscus]|uniref:AraC family transcriptional regulator n=1 Tax=Cystobacter fuscus TaxID=43 RepID=A0A250IYS4_9BACT|nr:AraC family transcriptional regulator [Cystobacter fuscus]ATB36885.1 AraC family transcriptional regulator [Cystobacter fuscus]
MMVPVDALDELRELTAVAENRRTETGIPRVAMVRGKVPEHELAAVYEPMINLILQGAKTMTIGERTLRYDPATYFVMSVDLPAVGTVHQGGAGRPYLAVSLSLEPRVIAEVLAHAPQRVGRGAGFAVASVSAELLDAWTRLLRLMRRPDEIPVLAPLYEREILFRVLQGPQGHLLREIAVPDSAISRVRLAIQWIRENYARPLRTKGLARIAAMSESAFHRHFKSVTTMSPLQFQKRLRLMQARSLLVESLTTASSVAFEVGYESSSQFNREYSRFFGRPPATDAREVRARLQRG